MPNVLIIGPTGFVGTHLAQALLRAGIHSVHGLVPTEKKGLLLTRDAIIPVIGSINDVQSALDIVKKHDIDIIVDTTSFNDDSTKPKLLDTIVGARKEILKTEPKEPGKARKLGLVTVSQIYSQGSTEDPLGSFEQASVQARAAIPLPASLDLVSAKAKYERSVLATSDVLDIAIIRPGFIFGRGGASWTRCLGGIYQASLTGSTAAVRVPIDPENQRFTMSLPRLLWRSISWMSLTVQA
jgi:nucleoside-diphosphate-sugar epimerase